VAKPLERHVVGERRINDRTEINRAAVLRIGDQAHPIQVENLTRDGCKIRTDLSLAPGLIVKLGFAGVGSTSARIVWRSTDGYGCAFDESLPPGAVTAALLNNVERLDDGATDQPIVSVGDVKWSRRRSAGVVVFSVVALWVALIAIVLLAR